MSKPTKLYIVRHGQTQWNRQQRMQGQKNSKLTEKGKAQAVKAGEALKDVHLDKAYVSTLERAVETLEIIITGRKMDVVCSHALREISLGPWEGKIMSEIEKAFPKEYAQFRRRPNQFCLPGAETFHQLQERSVAEIKSIVAEEKGRRILIVTHWMVIKVVLAHFAAIPLSRLTEIEEPENGSVTTLSVDEGV